MCQPANEALTILKLSQMHEVHGYLHTDVLWYYLYSSKRQANRFPALTDPVPTHQRYHSDFSSSSESPSVTSSDPDYGQGRSTEWNIYHNTCYWQKRRDAWHYTSYMYDYTFDPRAGDTCYHFSAVFHRDFKVILTCIFYLPCASTYVAAGSFASLCGCVSHLILSCLL